MDTKVNSKLERLLDTVKARKSELTLDVRGIKAEQHDLIIKAAQRRGFHVASDGRHMLIQDLRVKSDPTCALCDAGEEHEH